MKAFLKSTGYGAVIGFLGGVFSGGAMLVTLIVYEALTPNEHHSSTSIIMPFMGATIACVYGTVIGVIAGAAFGLAGFEVSASPISFSALILALVGTFLLLTDYQSDPARFLNSLWFNLGMDFLSPLVGGVVVGGLLALVLRSRKASMRLSYP